MANTNKQHQPGPGNTAAAKAKRAFNHSPAIERKRAENAWHTNPLAPIPPKVLRRQAVALMRTMYKPAFAQLQNEEKRVNSISEKRKSDNSYYLNWLNQQSELLNAHEDAARNQVLAAGQQAQQEVQAGWDQLHGDLAASMENTVGNVSNPAESTAFGGDVAAAALKSAHDIEDQRTATQNQLSELGDAATLGHSINMAEIAAMEGRRLSDQNEGLTSIRNARQETRLNKASEAAKTFKEGLDKEIEKAQARASIAASEATAAIEAKRFGLDASKAKLDAEEFNFEKGYKNRKFGLEQKELAQKKAEAKINREVQEGKLTQGEAKIKIEEAKLENEGKKIANEGARTPAEKAKAREKQQELNQHIGANINAVKASLEASPELEKRARKNRQQVERQLHEKYGYNSVAVKVAMEEYLYGHISQKTAVELREIGYNGSHLPNR